MRAIAYPYPPAGAKMAASKIRLDEEQKLIIRHLRTEGPTSRSDIALRFGLSNSSVTKVTRELISLSLIEEAAAREAQGRGRPSIPLRISPAGGYAIGAAVNRGALDIAIINYAGGVVAQLSEPFDSPDPQAFAQVVRARMHELAKKHRLLGSLLLGVGVGVPGYSKPGNQGEWWHVIESLSGWRDVPLAMLMEDDLGVPVWIENDANAAALAEFYLGGLLHRYGTAIVILLGHGIGAGVIADGHLFKGEFGNAGEIGMFYPNSPRPSTLDLLAYLREHGCDIWSVSDFEEKTKAHADILNEWTMRAAEQLELVVNTAQAWLSPGAIVISSPLPGLFLEKLAACIDSRTVNFRNLQRAQTVGVSKLGGAATSLGAALLPIHASVSP